MSQTEQNRQVLKAAYAEWHETRGGSVDNLMSIFAEDVAFGSLAEGRERAHFTAPRRSKAELQGYFNDLLESWTMNHFTVEALIADGDRVVMVGSTSWTNKATGKTCETPKVDDWQFRNGKAVRYYECYDTAALFEAAR